MPKQFAFDLTVTGLTPAQAQALYAFIVEEIEYYGASVGGGFAEVTENGDALEMEPTDGPTLTGSQP